MKLDMMIDDTIELYILDTSLIDLDLDSRSQECMKAKTSAAVISQTASDGGLNEVRGRCILSHWWVDRAH